MTESRKPAVLLLSGGLDSATCLAMAKRDGFDVHALTFDYGQRHRVELDASRRVAEALGAKSVRTMKLDLRAFGGSALTDDIDVPKADHDDDEDAIPSTYVPARNTILLSCALGLAEVIGARDIFIGANAVDYSGYPDCRPAFIDAFEALANVATAAGVAGERFTIHAPLLTMTKADIVTEGTALGVDYSLTHSCYDPVGVLACGKCDSCRLRARGFADAHLADPTRYVGAAPGRAVGEAPA